MINAAPLIKICGLRRVEDAEMVNACQADFAGLILTPSRRRVTPEDAIAIFSALRPQIRRVGVFAAESPEDVVQAWKFLSLDVLQLHMDVTEAYFAELYERLTSESALPRPMIWQRIGISPSVRQVSEIKESTKSLARREHFDRILLDTRKDRQDGGTGDRFPWEIAREYLRLEGIFGRDIVLAGGLNAGNVADAIRCLEPGVVDVSSGIETDGYKDSSKMSQFVAAVRKVGTN